MRLSRQAAVRLILSDFKSRSWLEPESTAVAAVDSLIASANGGAREFGAVVPTRFLQRNHVTREEVVHALEGILGGVEIEGAGPPQVPALLKILFLSANPDDQAPLRIDEEFRSIQRSLRATKLRDVIRLESRWASRAGDLIDAINEEQPQILHFSGHGSSSNETIFQDRAGGATAVPLSAIAAAIATVSDVVRLVVLNNCYSANVAESIVEEIEAAVGISDSISDDAARLFSRQLYSSLGYGSHLEKAFAQATAALKLEGIPEDQTPQLYTRTDIDAGKLVLIGQNTNGAD